MGGPTNYPATMLLIDALLANDRNFGDTNVGRRSADLGLKYAEGPYLRDRYCDDIQAGKSHAAGKVYDFFSYYYTVQYLENANLWQRLDQAVAAQGCSM